MIQKKTRSITTFGPQTPLRGTNDPQKLPPNSDSSDQETSDAERQKEEDVDETNIQLVQEQLAKNPAELITNAWIELRDCHEDPDAENLVIQKYAKALALLQQSIQHVAQGLCFSIRFVEERHRGSTPISELRRIGLHGQDLKIGPDQRKRLIPFMELAERLGLPFLAYYRIDRLDPIRLKYLRSCVVRTGREPFINAINLLIWLYRFRLKGSKENPPLYFERLWTNTNAKRLSQVFNYNPQVAAQFKRGLSPVIFDNHDIARDEHGLIRLGPNKSLPAKLTAAEQGILVGFETNNSPRSRSLQGPQNAMSLSTRPAPVSIPRSLSGTPRASLQAAAGLAQLQSSPAKFDFPVGGQQQSAQQPKAMPSQDEKAAAVLGGLGLLKKDSSPAPSTTNSSSSVPTSSPKIPTKQDPASQPNPMEIDSAESKSQGSQTSGEPPSSSTGGGEAGAAVVVKTEEGTRGGQPAESEQVPEDGEEDELSQNSSTPRSSRSPRSSQAESPHPGEFQRLEDREARGPRVTSRQSAVVATQSRQGTRLRQPGPKPYVAPIVHATSKRKAEPQFKFAFDLLDGSRLSAARKGPLEKALEELCQRHLSDFDAKITFKLKKLN